jgi:hypothetical protein
MGRRVEDPAEIGVLQSELLDVGAIGGFLVHGDMKYSATAA